MRDADGMRSFDATPREIEGAHDAVAVSGSRIRGCALDGAGAVACWGWRSTGFDRTDYDQAARPIAGLSAIVQVASGTQHHCALAADGRVLCWGGNGEGQLGVGPRAPDSLTSRATPTEVVGAADIVAIGAGYEHSCALRADGHVLCWGGAYHGQLGDGTTGEGRWEPREVVDLRDASALAVGEFHTCAIRCGGSVMCWGLGRNGQLGDPTLEDRSAPFALPDIDDAVEIAAGATSTCVRRASGVVSCWGDNEQGQLGVPPVLASLTPVTVSGIDDAVDLGAGANEACVVRSDGALACWGRGHARPVAIAGVSDAVEVVVGGGSSTDPWGPMYDFAGHACMRRTNGRVACWGDGPYGELGDGTVTDPFAPRREAPSADVSGIDDAIALSANGVHTCALRESGGIACWGGNQYGQIGAGSHSDSVASAAAVSLPAAATAVSAGHDDTMAILADGTPYVWGFVRYEGGDFGYYASTPEALAVGDDERPWELVPLGHVRALDAAAQCALRDDGTVACWGRGPHGLTGWEAWAGSLEPEPVAGMPSDVVELHDGCARTATGDVWCIHYDDRGARVAERVEGMSDVVEVDGGSRYLCARHDDGHVSCLGDNRVGQLGDGSALVYSVAAIDVSLP